LNLPVYLHFFYGVSRFSKLFFQFLALFRIFLYDLFALLIAVDHALFGHKSLSSKKHSIFHCSVLFSVSGNVVNIFCSDTSSPDRPDHKIAIALSGAYPGRCLNSDGLPTLSVPEAAIAEKLKIFYLVMGLATVPGYPERFSGMASADSSKIYLDSPANYFSKNCLIVPNSSLG
jgi:hypothetical protein